MNPLSFISSRISGRHLGVYQLSVTVFCLCSFMSLNNPNTSEERSVHYFLHCTLSFLGVIQRPILHFLGVLQRQKSVYVRLITRYHFKNNAVKIILRLSALWCSVSLWGIINTSWTTFFMNFQFLMNNFTYTCECYFLFIL